VVLSHFTLIAMIAKSSRMATSLAYGIPPAENGTGTAGKQQMFANGLPILAGARNAGQAMKLQVRSSRV
jgi:hypothetical protein